MNRLLEFIRDLRHPPTVRIQRFGQLTDRPQVHVAVTSRRGAQGVYTFDADEAGEAKATLYGRGLAEIMKRQLIDERT